MYLKLYTLIDTWILLTLAACLLASLKTLMQSSISECQMLGASQDSPACNSQRYPSGYCRHPSVRLECSSRVVLCSRGFFHLHHGPATQ